MSWARDLASRLSNALTKLALGGLVTVSLVSPFARDGSSPPRTIAAPDIIGATGIVKRVPTQIAAVPVASTAKYPQQQPDQRGQPALENSRPPTAVRDPVHEGMKPDVSADTPHWSDAEIAGALKECLRVLTPTGAEVEPQPPIRNGQCGTPAPVALRSVGKDKVVLNPAPLINCAVSAALAKWIDQTLQPAAREILGSPVARLIDTSSYACRNRNNEVVGPISEHAFANAIDIGGFVLADGRTIKVLDSWGTVARDAKPSIQTGGTSVIPPVITGRAVVHPVPSAHQTGATGPTSVGIFLHRIHAEACRQFTTVLGPEANDEHRSHLHFDLKIRRGQHICQ